MLSMSISEQITDCEIELAMLEDEREELWKIEEHLKNQQKDFTEVNGLWENQKFLEDIQPKLIEVARNISDVDGRIRDVGRRLEELEQQPDWVGWIYYYDEKIRKLSYDKYNYEIDLTKKKPIVACG